MLAHPCLYATRRQLEVAKRNIARYEWAKQTYGQLKAEADKLAGMELPKFETDWWQEARKKDWRLTYPEINLHTGSVPRPAMNAAFQSALVYRLGGEDICAERAKPVLLHYTAYTFEFVHPDVGLNYASWGIQALWAYDLLCDRFTPQEKAEMDDFFRRMLNAVVKNDDWWIAEGLGGRFNNHYTWHKLMMAAYGLFYDKPEWVDRTINGNQGIRELMDHGFLDDGLWFESSLNYHYTALHGLLPIALMLRNAGHPFDLFTREFANGRTLEQGLSAMVQELFPDTTVPQIGDTYGHTVCLPDEQSYETAWVVYQKPLYGWLMSQKKQPFQAISLFREREPGSAEAPAVASRVFPEHGHVMLRSIEGKEYWNSDSWAAFLSHDLDSIHAHHDKLGLILFGRGRVLAQDVNAAASVPHAFSAKVTSQLDRTTLCHNTIMVDGKDHPYIGEKLSLIEFKPLPSVKTATVGDLKGLVYEGVRMQRTVAVTDATPRSTLRSTSAYVLDVFQAASEAEHTYDWLFHTLDDEGNTRTEGDFKPVRLPDGPPWSWLRNARSARLDGTWNAEWRQGDVRFRLTMLGAPGTEVTLCDFPRNDEFEPPPMPMLMVQRKGKSAAFVALYQAEKRDLPPVEISASEGPYDMLRVKVTLAGKTREHLIPKLK
ncbi:MAG TPA: alginate lyase family protein [Armatimonadota bacterium]|nr:alginate lyase family protein [Armatimonadota bacterium]